MGINRDKVRDNVRKTKAFWCLSCDHQLVRECQKCPNCGNRVGTIKRNKKPGPSVETTKTMTDSPCIKVCKIDNETKLCQGCYRHIDEITKWRDMSDIQKRIVLSLVEKRKKPYLTREDLFPPENYGDEYWEDINNEDNWR